MRYVIAVICALAVVAAQVLYGGAMRPVFALPAMMLIALAGALGVVAVFWKNVPPPSFWCVSSVALLAGWLIWREWESPDAWLAAGYLRLTVACFVIYLIFAAVLTNPFHRLAYVCVLFAVAILQAGAAGWQFSKPESGPVIPWLSEQLRVWYESRANWRGHGTYLNANHLAWFLNVAGFLALSLTCWGRWGLKTKLVCLYASLASFAGAMLTLSRGGMLGFGAGMSFFLLLSAVAMAVGARNRRLIALVVVAAVVLLFGSLGFFAFKSSIAVQQRFEDLTSDSYRPAVYEAVLRQAQLQPLLGTGAGTFLYYGRRYRELTNFADDIYAHNDWMQIVGDFGFPALVILICVVFTHGINGFFALIEVLQKRMRSHSRPQSHAAALLIGAMCCLAAFVIHSFFDFNMQIPANAILAASILGMLANPGVLSQSGSTRLQGIWRRGVCIGVGASGVWLATLAFGALRPEYQWLQVENTFLRGKLQEALILSEAGRGKFESNSRLERAVGEIFIAAAEQGTANLDRRRWAAAAINPFERSSELVPGDSLVLTRLARSEKLAGKGRRAEESAIRAIICSPLQGYAYELYGEILEENGRLSEAMRAYMIARQLPGSRNANQRAGELSRKLLILDQ